MQSARMFASYPFNFDSTYHQAPLMVSKLALPWRARASSQLHWRSWGDEFVVYHAGSGDTHQLDPIAAELLKSLAQEPASTFELVTRVSVSLELEADDDLFEYMEKVLCTLSRLDLIEQS